jgi:shikimate dehydrogenase
MKSIKYYSLGLIGRPLGHSLSPKIHNTALETLGLHGTYQAYEILPEQIPSLLNRVRDGEITGLNVTIPYKQIILSMVDQCSAVAKAVGAINTIYLKDDELTGENTDVDGFWIDLENKIMKFITVNTKNALILGSGGSARAVVHALHKADYECWIFARRPSQANELIETIQHGTDGRIHILNSLSSILEEIPFSLVINTTPVGMHPDHDSNPWPKDLSLPEGILIYDLIYNPRITSFMRQAQNQNLPAFNGLGMLVEQAALSFRLWTGLQAPREEMWKAVSECL